MKSSALILSLLMLFSIIQPLVVCCRPVSKEPLNPMKGCGAAKACHKKARHTPADKKEEKGCDGTLACNPFAGCAQCQYMPVAKTGFDEALFIYHAVAAVITNEYAIKGFLSDCWHPPEFAFV